jgi:transposase
VAMESTGVYWTPVWNILAEQFDVLLANAQHIKAVPGRKTDQKDSEWIANCCSTDCSEEVSCLHDQHANFGISRGIG